MQACGIVTRSNMAFAPSPAVPLLLLLSCMALAGLAHAAKNGACSTITGKKSCMAQSSCCWGGIPGTCGSATFATDNYNCGSCGNVCKKKDSCCNGICRSFSTDDNNCGACGNRCTGGTICVAGVCKCPTPTVNGQCWTGTKCVKVTGSFATDTKNCGNCGNRCAAGASCCSGSNPGTCTDTSTDSSNCGACGNICPEGWSCVSGGQCGLYLPANASGVVFDWSVVFELPEPGRGYIQFTALASNDVHVVFNGVAEETDQPHYGIYVGGNADRESAIVHFEGDGRWYRDYYWGTVLEHPGGLNDLWMSMDKTTETVEVGRGVRGTASSQVIMSFHDQGRFLSNVRYMTFGGAFSTPVTYTNIAVHPLGLD